MALQVAALAATRKATSDDLLGQLLVVALIFDAGEAVNYVLTEKASVLHETHQ